MRQIKILVAFSGGKDSTATLIWVLNESGFKKENIQAVYCDTGWEAEETYSYIDDVCKKLGVKLVTLKSKYNFISLAKKKKRFPSKMAQFCTEWLKVRPMIDYILSLNCHVIIYQGIRSKESESRSKMEKQCTYFKYYFEPYGFDKKGKPKYHSYRKKDVKTFVDKFLHDVVRPVFEWTGREVLNYILDAGLKPNPLYYKGVARVGCYPCVNINQKELKTLIKNDPSIVRKLNHAENEIGRTFFKPDYVPVRARHLQDIKTKKMIPSTTDVVNYLNDKSATMEMFEEEDTGRCMSFYNICE